MLYPDYETEVAVGETSNGGGRDGNGGGGERSSRGRRLEKRSDLSVDRRKHSFAGATSRRGGGGGGGCQSRRSKSIAAAQRISMNDDGSTNGAGGILGTLSPQPSIEQQGGFASSSSSTRNWSSLKTYSAESISSPVVVIKKDSIHATSSPLNPNTTNQLDLPSPLMNTRSLSCLDGGEMAGDFLEPTATEDPSSTLSKWGSCVF